MRIGIVTPAPPGSRYGNRVTALRWARLLRELGHRIDVRQEYRGEPFDLLIALHAQRSYESIRGFHQKHRGRPLIVALSGTDVYLDLRRRRHIVESLGLATRIVVLQPKAIEELKVEMHRKVRVIYQSVAAGPFETEGGNRARAGHAAAEGGTFDVCVVGHLRPVKDPFRAALASRLLPTSSRIRVIHVGKAMTEAMEQRARREMKTNRRYMWFGEQPPARAQRILGGSDLCVLSSRMEGGANVLSEAIVASVPILASRIPGSIGILGEEYPGYFTTGGTRELASLMVRAEADPAFTTELICWCDKLIPQFKPCREKEAWAGLLDELFIAKRDIKRGSPAV
ncbi:MAG TPA: selenoneine biosynthesis selenosugar synthase SenB [Blastocatellia bacterium]|nr:selenoneine biosynthesis selenosugar synthase SenB [Blastocatellia bacterium]